MPRCTTRRRQEIREKARDDLERDSGYLYFCGSARGGTEKSRDIRIFWRDLGGRDRDIDIITGSVWTDRDITSCTGAVWTGTGFHFSRNHGIVPSPVKKSRRKRTRGLPCKKTSSIPLVGFAQSNRRAGGRAHVGGQREQTVRRHCRRTCQASSYLVLL